MLRAKWVSMFAICGFVLVACDSEDPLSSQSGLESSTTRSTEVGSKESPAPASGVPATVGTNQQTQGLEYEVRVTPPTGQPPSNGPGPNAKPMLWVTHGSSYFCPASPGDTPSVVVYDDFSVLDVEGGSCGGSAKIVTGRINPDLVTAWIDDFNDIRLAGLAAVSSQTEDGGDSFLHFAPGDGSVQVARSINDPSGDLATGEDRKRLDAMHEIINDLRIEFVETGTRKPEQLVVEPGYLYPETPKRGEKVPNLPIDKPILGCEALDPADTEVVVERHGGRPSTAFWKVKGKVRVLSLGVVLPGFPPC